MMRSVPIQSLLLLLLPHILSLAAGSSLHTIWVYYGGNRCGEGTPYSVYTEADTSCSTHDCYEDGNMSSTGVGVVFVDCTTDYKTSMKEFFGDAPFIMVEAYDDVVCESLAYAEAMLVSSKCEGSPNQNSSQNYHVIATVGSDGSAVIDYYFDSMCHSSQLMDSYMVDKYTLETHKCDHSSTKWYYFDGEDNLGSASADKDGYIPEKKTSKVWYLILGGVLTLLFIGVGICCCKRKTHVKQTEAPEPATTSIQTRGTGSLNVAVHGQVGLWNDDVITAKRIPRDKVRVKKLLSRGAFGEVYEGVFNGNLVAVKMLVPHTRGDLKHVNDFLAEAKLTATMDHPNIVSFVGVAWDALSDICVVMEFMENGDLRELLTKYEENHHPVGFDHQKTSIALQVCHALTYLHSLLPPVIHRDLKSRNILLNNAMEAKLTDFGISKETRSEQTMTAGVGTSLWMAPEVMLGERYDVKADMFSFGVVLSELDLHTLPYAQAKEQVRDSNGRKLPDAAILQQVAMGILKVEFSQSTPAGIVELGLACVSLNPRDRPTAAEALYRLQVILTKDFA